MSIFNVNPDPDYPVLTSAGFSQYTYQTPYNNAAGAQQYYYNGQTIAPSGWQQPQPMGGYPMESRRYDAPVQQPFAQQPMIPQPQQQVQYQYNQLVESRRVQQAAPVQNPWGGQTVQQPVPQFTPAQPIAPTVTTYPSTEYSALATCHPTFDKKNAWGDQQVYNPVPAPVVNWSGVAAQPMQQFQYANQIPAMQYPTQPMAQPVQQSWEELAKQNFGK